MYALHRSLALKYWSILKKFVVGAKMVQQGAVTAVLTGKSHC